MLRDRLIVGLGVGLGDGLNDGLGDGLNDERPVVGPAVGPAVGPCRVGVGCALQTHPTVQRPAKWVPVRVPEVPF